MKHNATMSSAGISVAARMLALVLLAAAAMPADAQQFSADLVARKDETTTLVGSLRVSERKVRIEATTFPDGFFLIDTARPEAYFVRPSARVYMDAMQSSPLTRMFVAVDPDDPCRQWQVMAQLAAPIDAKSSDAKSSDAKPVDEKPIDQKSWRCERDGTEVIAGRSTDIYRVEAPSGISFVGWVDRARRFPSRVRIADGTMIIAEHIRDEPQPAQSFEIPVGVRKFDPQALIRRIKQSDVWVAPPASE